VANPSAQRRGRPKSAPALAAVVTVPGPIKAAEITDQNRMFTSRFLTDMKVVDVVE
jgi:hypothetical protein